MKKLKLFIVALFSLVLVAAPQKTQAGPAEIPLLTELVIQGTSLGASAFTIVSTVQQMAEEVMEVVRVIQAVVQLYQSSRDLVAMADKTAQIYKIYLETLIYIGEHVIYLTAAEIETLIYTMDAAAFDLAAADTVRPKGLKQVANGALENLPQLIKMMTGLGQGVSIRDITELVENTTEKINTSYTKTVAARVYVRSSINQSKINSGVYQVQQIIKEYREKYLTFREKHLK